MIILIVRNGFSNGQTLGILNDPRDGKEYKTIKIGRLEIMAENLNYDDFGLCYEKENLFCQENGRLYNYREIIQNDGEKGQGICPQGWHVPSESEWRYIFTRLDGKINTTTSGHTILSTFNNKLNLTYSGLGNASIKEGHVRFFGIGESGYYATSSIVSRNYFGKVESSWGIVSYNHFVKDPDTSEEFKFSYMLRDTNILNYLSCRCVKNY